MDAIETLKKNKPEITKKYPISRLGVFGSFAKGKATPESDVDVLVEFSEPVDFFAFIDVKDFLEAILKTRVDLVTVKALKPALKDRILNEVIYV
jgi:predicted nucleotidyltransferase